MSRWMKSGSGIASFLALWIGVGLTPAARAQDAPPAGAPGSQGGGPTQMLMGMMKGAPGLLGMESAQAQSRKLVIFAWFKDRASAREWYLNGVPKMIRGMAQLAGDAKEPLQNVPENVPVMAVLAFGAPPEGAPPSGRPFGSASVEFYTPAPGGFAFVGRFAPETVKVPGLLFDKGDRAPSKPAETKPADGAKPNGAKPADDSIFKTDLVKELKASPGCVGADALVLPGGKLAVAGWFKDKKAVMDWYASNPHAKMMTAMPPPTRAPLKDVKSEKTPILVVASLTPTKDGKPGPTGMPVTQIAIELYYLADGGFIAGGSLAPANLVIPGVQK